MFNDHQSHPDPSTESNNLNTYLDTKYSPKNHQFQESIIQLATKTETAPAPTTGGLCTITCSYDVCFKDNREKNLYPPTNTHFMVKTPNQDKTMSPSTNPTLQFGQDITYIDSEGSRLTAIITIVTGDTSSGKTTLY